MPAKRCRGNWNSCNMKGCRKRLFAEVQSKPKEIYEAKEFDNGFDDGKDVSEFLDFSQAERPDRQQKRVNVDFPIWMIQSQDKVWIAERLKELDTV